MYYLKSRYYDPELRRFISADVIAVTSTSSETFHNQNLYAYCDGNPLIRKDEDGNIWQMIAGAAISFVAGAAFSVATQVLVDHKKINEVNWVDAVAAGTSTALGVIGVNSAIQIGVTVVESIASSRYEGLSWEKSVYNGAVDGVVDTISSQVFLIQQDLQKIHIKLARNGSRQTLKKLQRQIFLIQFPIILKREIFIRSK